MSQGGYHENWAIIGINLVPLSERKRYATEIVEQLRNDINIEKMPHFTKIVINKIAKGPPTGSEVEVKIIGDDYNKIDEIKVKIKNELASISGIINIEDSAFNGKDELVLVLNYDRIAQLDLNVASIASTIRTAYDGTVATYIQTSDNKLDFRVKIKDDYQKDMTFLYNLLISNNQGRLIRLKDVAHFKSSESKATIDHYDGDRVVSVTAGIKSDSDLTSSKVMLQLKPYLKTLKNEYNDIDLVVCPDKPTVRTDFVEAVFQQIVHNPNFYVMRESPKGSAPVLTTHQALYTPFKLFAFPNLRGEMVKYAKQFDMTFVGTEGGSTKEVIEFHRSNHLAFCKLEIV